MRRFTFLTVLLAILVSTYLIWNYWPVRVGIDDEMVKVFTPKSGDTISNPVHIEGEARGNWYFEASFPVRIFDANGKELAVVPAQAQSDPESGVNWMTTEFVPFNLDITFETPTTKTGTIILEKDNPSGLPEHADERRIPVKFK